MGRYSRTMDDSRKVNRLLWLLVIAGLVIRVAAVLVLNDYRSPLTAEYGIVAENLVAGKGFTGGGWLGPEAPTALNVPGYPVFLAVWLRLGGPLPYLGVQLSQALLSALLIYIVSRIALLVSRNATVSILSGILIAVYPPLIYFCIQISPAIFITFFAMLSLYVLLLFLRRPTWLTAIGSGVVFGISLLVEPILLFAIPGALLVVWKWWPRGDRKALVWPVMVSAIACSLVVLPWTVRNYEVFQRVVTLKTSFGLNLWLGNNPNATGYLYTATGVPMQDTLSEDATRDLARRNEAERYAVLEREAWTWILSHPGEFLRLTVRRLGYLWWISPTYRITDQNITEPRFFYAARAGIQALLLLFGVAGGLLAAWRDRLLLSLSLWWLVAFTTPYAITVAGNTRYRLPAEPLLVILSAYLLAQMYQR